jgi:hypothetical protein
MNDEHREIDALRYSILRKLVPGVRHALFGGVQAIQFGTELAQRLLKKGADSERIDKSMNAMHGGCAEILNSGRAMISWLEPDQGGTTSVNEGLRQCIRVTNQIWLCRETEIALNLPTPEVSVSQTAFQEMVVIALLVLADTRSGAFDLVITGAMQAPHFQLALHAQTVERSCIGHSEIAYRVFEWHDINLLATAHGILCSYTDSDVSLTFPIVP